MRAAADGLQKAACLLHAVFQDPLEHLSCSGFHCSERVVLQVCRSMCAVLLPHAFAGLDNAGKTTVLYRLHLGQNIITHPTVGSNVEQVKHGKLTFEVSGFKGGAGCFAPVSALSALSFSRQPHIGDHTSWVANPESPERRSNAGLVVHVCRCMTRRHILVPISNP